MKKIGFYANIWALKPWEILDYVKAFEETHTEGLHFDIMDGHYVPNLAMGVDEAPLWHSLTRIPLDFHVMAYEPERIIERYELREGDRVSIHPETTAHPYRVMEELRDRGVRTGYTISPSITMDYVREALPVLDFVNFMAVNPGFFGKPMVPNAIEKLERLRQICDLADHHIEITVDGSIIPEHGRLYVQAGADSLVAGPSTLEKEGPSKYAERMEAYCREIGVEH
ncbi:MAG: hypothetical protein IKX74_00695 [Erysipelotrichaceae bacterium]|nr:hypothetical protein [Erysipelotrichaceae bacterium]MBR5048165.1 hypothetical protein [Erysipelotrichaceae bacterium]